MLKTSKNSFGYKKKCNTTLQQAKAGRQECHNIKATKQRSVVLRFFELKQLLSVSEENHE